MSHDDAFFLWRVEISVTVLGTRFQMSDFELLPRLLSSTAVHLHVLRVIPPRASQHRQRTLRVVRHTHTHTHTHTHARAQSLTLEHAFVTV